MINIGQQEYKRIAGELKRKIVVGEFKADEKLITERKLAEMLEVSRVTIRSALQELERENLIYRRQGAGTFISKISDQGNSLDNNSICLVYKNYRQTSIADDPYGAMLFDGLNKASAKLGFRISIMPIDSEDTFLNCIKNRPEFIPKSKGIIIGNGEWFAETYEWLAERGYSVMALGGGEKLDQEEYSYVDIENKAGGKMAAEHLLQQGRKSMVFFSGANNSACDDRVKGIAAAFAEQQMSFEENRVKYLKPWSKEDGHKVMMEVIKEFPDLDSVIIHGDLATLGALNALQENGIKVPDDVALISYDDFPWMEKINSPAVTAIRQPFDDMAESAAEMLMENMNSLNPAIRIKIIQPVLKIRESCGARIA